MVIIGRTCGATRGGTKAPATRLPLTFPASYSTFITSTSRLAHHSIVSPVGDSSSRGQAASTGTSTSSTAPVQTAGRSYTMATALTSPTTAVDVQAPFVRATLSNANDAKEAGTASVTRASVIITYIKVTSPKSKTATSGDRAGCIATRRAYAPLGISDAITIASSRKDGQTVSTPAATPYKRAFRSCTADAFSRAITVLGTATSRARNHFSPTDSTRQEYKYTRQRRDTASILTSHDKRLGILKLVES